MPRYHVHAAHRDTGAEVTLAVDADGPRSASQWAADQGFLVSGVEEDERPATPRPGADREVRVPPLGLAGTGRPLASEAMIRTVARFTLGVSLTFSAIYFGTFVLSIIGIVEWANSIAASAAGTSSLSPAIHGGFGSPSPPPPPLTTLEQIQAWGWTTVIVLSFLFPPAAVLAAGATAWAALNGIAERLRLARRELVARG